jgi:hypothetical protein
VTDEHKSRLIAAIVESCSALDEGSQQWVRSRLMELDQNSAVLQAIAHLHGAGCDATVILLWAKMHSEVSTEGEFRKKTASWEMVKRRAAELAPKLKQLAGEIDELHNTQIDRGSFLELYIERIRKTSPAAAVEDDVVETVISSLELLPATLRDYADDVASYANLTVDLPTAFTHIRDFYLALLCVYTEKIASTSKYADLAEVIAFVDHSPAPSAEELERRYRSFRTQNPDIVTRMQKFVRSYDRKDSRTQQSFLSWSQNHWPF